MHCKIAADLWYLLTTSRPCKAQVWQTHARFCKFWITLWNQVNISSCPSNGIAQTIFGVPPDLHDKEDAQLWQKQHGDVGTNFVHLDVSCCRYYNCSVHRFQCIVHQFDGCNFRSFLPYSTVQYCTTLFDYVHNRLCASSEPNRTCCDSTRTRCLGLAIQGWYSTPVNTSLSHFGSHAALENTGHIIVLSLHVCSAIDCEAFLLFCCVGFHATSCFLSNALLVGCK